jgi:Rod binding domain-containing protein
MDLALSNPSNSILPLKATDFSATRLQPMQPRTLSFDDLLPVQRKATPTDHDRLTKQAEIWVSQTFFGTMLKQLRESPFRSELFDGGRGGQAFGSLYDQHLAEHMTRGAGKKLVRSIVRKIEAKQAYARQAGSGSRVAGLGTENSTSANSRNPDPGPRNPR